MTCWAYSDKVEIRYLPPSLPIHFDLQKRIARSKEHFLFRNVHDWELQPFLLQKSIKDSILIPSQGEASTLSHDRRVPAKSCLVSFTRCIPCRSNKKHRYLKWCFDRQYLSYLCSGISFPVNIRLSWSLIPYLDFENESNNLEEREDWHLFDTRR